MAPSRRAGAGSRPSTSTKKKTFDLCHKSQFTIGEFTFGTDLTRPKPKQIEIPIWNFLCAERARSPPLLITLLLTLIPCRATKRFDSPPCALVLSSGMAAYRSYAESPVKCQSACLGTNFDGPLHSHTQTRGVEDVHPPFKIQSDRPAHFLVPQSTPNPPLPGNLDIYKPHANPSRLDRYACTDLPPQRQAQMDEYQPPSSGEGSTLRAGGRRSWRKSCGSPAGCEHPWQGSHLRICRCGERVVNAGIGGVVRNLHALCVQLPRMHQQQCAASVPVVRKGNPPRVTNHDGWVVIKWRPRGRRQKQPSDPRV